MQPARAAPRRRAVDLAGEVESFFTPEVADEPSVGAMLRRPLMIDARQLQVVAVRPRLLGKEIVRKIGLRA